MIDLAQADRTMRTNGEPFDRFASLSRLERQNAALIAALERVLRMDVKGHELQDRLQFSETGRDILAQAHAAIAAAKGQA